MAKQILLVDDDALRPRLQTRAGRRLMLRTLRSRLIVSHMLPLLVVVPLMGIALVYVLETRSVLVNLARQITSQAVLVARMAESSPEIWGDPATAQAFVDKTNPLFSSDLVLISRTGKILAVAGDELYPIGEPAPFAATASALAGQNVTQTNYTLDSRAERVEVLVPARGAGGEVVGIVRLTDSYETAIERFWRLRTLIFEVLVAGLALGALAGWLLALRLERPIERATLAVDGLASGRALEVLPEEGPDELRRLLRAANTLGARLRALEGARRQLLANIVHELGRPLGALRAANYALLNGAADDLALRRELLTGVDGELNILERLLADLAELLDRVLGTLELQRKPVDLSNWLPSVLSPWAEAAGQKGLRWQAHVDPALPCLQIDPGRLGQALGNLLSNAVKYTPPGGLVRFDSAVDGHERAGQALGRDAGGESRSNVWLRVSDTGPGIAPADLERIFEAFYRGMQGRFPQGMGLGLTIADELVTAHGGTLEVESTPGEGSAFTIRLPLAGPATSERPAARVAA